MTRLRCTDYAGAGGRLSLDRVRELGAGWAVQPKVDGAYARVHLDGRGRVVNVFSRTGRPFPVEQWADLRGALVGAPHAELVGELEAHTEAGNAAAAARGHRAVHFFDVIHDGRRRLVDQPYRERYSALCWMQAEAAQQAESGRWQDEDQGVRDRVTGRWSREVLGASAIARAPLVPLLPVRSAGQLWDAAVSGELEGLVVVALDAKLGARRAKLKVKPRNTLDCQVLAVDAKAAIVAAGPLRFVVSARAGGDRELVPGAIVEVAHEGWYGSGVPRFARILRSRPDLGGMIGG
jgi:ATP-dependent DNA ligase